MRCPEDIVVPSVMRVSDTMWHTLNCHSFSRVFRYRKLAEPKYPAFYDICKEIGGPCYDYVHDLVWALIGLNALAEWSAHFASGSGDMVELTPDRI